MLDDQPDQQPDQTSGQSGDHGGESTAPKVTKTTRKRTSRVVTPASSDPALEAEAGPSAAPEAGAAPAAKKAAAKKAATKKAPAAKAAAKKTTAKKAATKKTTAKTASTAKKSTATPTADAAAADEPVGEGATPADAPAAATPKVTKTTRTRTPRTAAAAPLFQAPDATRATSVSAQDAETDEPSAEEKPAKKAAAKKTAAKKTAAKKTTPKKTTARKSAAKKTGATEAAAQPDVDDSAAVEDESGAVAEQVVPDTQDDAATTGDARDAQDSDDAQASEDDADEGGAPRRRRRRGGRRRRKSGGSGGGSGSEESGDDSDGPRGAQGDAGPDATSDADNDDASSEGGSSRRRRRRRRAGEDGGGGDDDPKNTVTRVRQGRSAEDQITSLAGSTRLEAKKQRRREGREAGRRRAPIISEAEFLARREAVDRTMVVRQRDDLTQIAVLEDTVLVEHYVARESQTSLIGNVYLGRVQNVLPSMEAAFIDIGKGRNAVLYAGEVNWSALGHKEGQPRKIESVLQSGQSVLVQVTKDPVGHKGARLTSQISLAGRFLVLVPDGTTNGISRKLPDTERSRLKSLLKEILPEGAGVIVRTAAEGASEEQLTRDVERLRARWDDIEAKTGGSAPQLLYGEPDLTLKVVRDLFTEDFVKLVIDGDDAWDTVHQYVSHVAPDLEERLERFEPATEGKHAGQDVFGAYRIDEQIKKGLDRKVWLPSGGSLIIDRTEAMTVVDVNTGKFTGSGGNLEETVTKNNLEAAEEIVRQLRLRDIGGIIVVDFIDMVLESNRDLVVRRLVECLGRDRTRHQVAEVTSLGLVQMTRKRIGTGLVEAFSHTCEHCQGRGVVIEDAPVETSSKRGEDESRKGRRSRGGRSRGSDTDAGSGKSKGSGGGAGGNGGGPQPGPPSPADVAAMARKPADEGAAGAGEGASTEEPGEPTPPAGRVTDDGQATDQPVDDQPPAEAAPTTRVVTRTRRRASRPAGPPAGDAATEVPEAASQPDRPEPVSPDLADPPAPISTTDGSDVPAEHQPSGVGTPPVSGAVEPGTVDVEPGHAPDDGPDDAHVDAPDDAHADVLDESGASVAHVPIKRKGSRKR